MNIALVGNPNTGKTTLFNLLTGANQKVGNLPGVTVEKKEGYFHIGKEKIDIVDLPGIYSLDPNSAEQKLARDFLVDEKPDLIINIIDSTSLERNLFLTLQLRTLGIPVIGVLSMLDEAQKKDIEIDILLLSGFLKLPLLPISVQSKNGLDKLFEMILIVNDKDALYMPPCASCSGCDHCSSSSKLYSEIEFIMANCVKHNIKEQRKDLSHYIDAVVLNKFAALPIFFLIMFGVFSLSFSGPATYISGAIHTFLSHTLSSNVGDFLAGINAPNFVIAAVRDGVFPGISSVISFLPQIAIIFILLSILEDCGYMTRAAFVADKLLSFTGLSGSSFIPLIMGFGCTVPAIMACRTLPSKKDRILTTMILPFMACSARFPLIALFAGNFFPKNQGMFVFLMYLVGILVSFLAALILNRAMFKNEPSLFIMEMPPYRSPIVRNLAIHTWDKVKGFLVKAGTTLFAASVIIWFLSNYSFDFSQAANMKDSIIASVSGILAPIFIPLGFGNWQAVASLATGVGAKEMIISTMSVLYPNGITAAFTTANALSFVVFSLLYLPCISTIIIIKKELGSFKLTALTLAFSFTTAYIVSFVVYLISSFVLR